MKKIILLFAVALFSTPFLSAQEFEVGTNVVNVGIGFGGYYSGWSGSSQSPVLSASYERGIWEVGGPGVVSLGAFVGRKSYNVTTLGTKYKWSYTSVGVRGAYHYTGFDVDNLDVYGGVAITYDIYSGSRSTYGRSDPNFGGFIGGRWYFSDTFAAFAEAGYGAAYLTLGVALRF